MGEVEETVREVISEQFPWLSEVDQDWVTNPQQKVVALFIALALYITSAIADLIESAYDVLETPIETVSRVLLTAVGRPAAELFTIFDQLNRTAASLAGAGPLAPVLVLVLWTAEMFVLYLFARAVARTVVVIT